jgi:hypothetical protein
MAATSILRIVIVDAKARRAEVRHVLGLTVVPDADRVPGDVRHHATTSRIRATRSMNSQRR